MRTCPECNGRGRTYGMTCDGCRGTGIAPDVRQESDPRTVPITKPRVRQLLAAPR